IAALRIDGDVDAGALTVAAASSARVALTVEVVVSDGGREVARASGASGTTLVLPIAQAKLWWPDAPFLYDLRVELKDAAGHVCDAVTSYAGLRKIAVGPGPDGRTRMLLNNTFVLQIGLLDQGFWPDGVYTAPSDAALRSDLEAAKRLGCNMLRKHVKVEPERWYSWADRLGVLVWQDMPGVPEMGYRNRTACLDDLEGNFESELRRMVQGRVNHPSLIVWVPFNEGWGLPLAEKRQPGDADALAPAGRAREERMVTAIRAEDRTRLIDAESGAGGGANQGANLWDAGFGDLIDYHCYGGDAPRPEAARASVIGEAGWGLALVASIRGRLATSPQLGESAIVITQLTDVENETNGALTYDRREKADCAAIGVELVKAIRAAGYATYPR
ncbi:MAG: glycoside hydrolase family 2, partial [Planctomycetes bacterium]|nr:glycoside hydrolase family 2 [Planctomycetota bacterium]